VNIIRFLSEMFEFKINVFNVLHIYANIVPKEVKECLMLSYPKIKKLKQNYIYVLCVCVCVCIKYIK